MEIQPLANTSEIDTPSAAEAVQTVLRFLRVMYHRKAYIIAAVVVSCLLGTYYYFTATRIYEAHASLLITRTGADVLNSPASMDASREALIPTYERLFKTAVVLDGALAQLQSMDAAARIDLAGLPSEEWVAALREGLSAQSLRGTNLIEVSFKSKSPGAAKAVVGALVKSYLDFMDKNHKDVSVEIVTVLENERTQIESQLN